MIVADASWVIALRDPAGAHHTAASSVAAATEDEDILLHAVTFAECLVAPARMHVAAQAAADLREAFTIVYPDSDAPLRWAELRASTGLRLPDAVVLDTALTHGATTIATFDDRLLAVAESRGIGRATA